MVLKSLKRFHSHGAKKFLNDENKKALQWCTKKFLNDRAEKVSQSLYLKKSSAMIDLKV